MSQLIEYSALGHGVMSFTTKRSLGRNRQRICELLSIDDSRLIIPHQTHTDRILEITEPFFDKTDAKRKELLEGIDAVFTRVPGVCIGVSTADCIPILLYDPIERVAGAVHAGWRGTVKRITRKTIETMVKTCGVNPESLRAVIAPGISMPNFEVGEEVYKEFSDAGFDMSVIARHYQKWHINLKECNRQQLLECGVKSWNIYVEQLCTCEHTDILFSARAEHSRQRERSKACFDSAECGRESPKATTGAEKCGRNFNAVMIIP